MFMRERNDYVKKIVSNNHLFITDLLNFISLYNAEEKVPNNKSNENLDVFLQKIKNLKKKVSYDQLKLLNVITATKLKEHVFKLKNENVNYMEQYDSITNSYINLINGEFSDDNIYSDQVIESFNYFYSTLIKGKTYNKEYGIVDSKLPDLISIDEFRREWTLQSSCPYCDITQLEFDASSVDHFFPKKKYPLLAIYPDNLIVSCTACNDRLKKDELNIPCAHPYFDNVEKYFSFYVNIDSSITINLNSDLSSIEETKINNYLRLFKISERYNTNGKSIIQDLKNIIRSNVAKELTYKQEIDYRIIYETVEKELKEQLESLIEKKLAKSFVKLQIDYLNQIILNEDYKKELVEYVRTHILY